MLIITARLPLCSGEAAWFAASGESRFLKDYVKGEADSSSKPGAKTCSRDPVKSFQKKGWKVPEPYTELALGAASASGPPS